MPPTKHILHRIAAPLVAAATLAAPLAGNDLFDLSLEELLEVKITAATLSPKTLNTAPASVTLFTGQEIENLGVRTLEELLNFAPGYQSAKRGDGSQATPYSARGRAIGTSSTEVIVLVDGRRIDNTVSGGQSTTIPGYSLTHVETVEFLRGPASALYGSNAFLGVINITTRRDQNNLQLTLGSQGTHGALANLTQSNESGLTLHAHAKFEESEGHRYRIFDKFTNQTVELKDPHQSFDFDLNLDYKQTELSFFHTERQSDGYLVLGNLNPDFNASTNRFSLLSVRQPLHIEALSSLDLSAGIRRRQFVLSTQTSPAGALAPISQPPSDAPILVKADIVEIEPWLKLDGTYQSAANYDLLFGLEYRSQDVSENAILSNYDLGALGQNQFPVAYYDGEFRPGEKSTNPRDEILGAYLQLENNLPTGDTLTLALRYDDFSYASPHLSPRITFVRPFQETGFLKLIWGEAYRTPNISERIVSPNNIQIGNPSLKPETVSTAELVIGGNWSDAYASLSLFENTFKDSIVQGVVNGVRTFTNSRQETSQGIEAESILQLGESTSLRASATHFFNLPDSSYRDSQTLASLNLNHSADAWNLNLSAIYHSSQKTPTPSPALLQTLPAYTVLNAKIRYRLSPQNTLSLTLSNLLDEDYRTASQPLVPDGVPNPGRALTIDYQYHW